MGLFDLSIIVGDLGACCRTAFGADPHSISATDAGNTAVMTLVRISSAIILLG